MFLAMFFLQLLKLLTSQDSLRRNKCSVVIECVSDVYQLITERTVINQQKRDYVDPVHCPMSTATTMYATTVLAVAAKVVFSFW